MLALGEKAPFNAVFALIISHFGGLKMGRRVLGYTVIRGKFNGCLYHLASQSPRTVGEECESVWFGEDPIFEVGDHVILDRDRRGRVIGMFKVGE